EYTEGPNAGFVAAHLGKDELVLVNCLTEEQSFKEHRPTFEKLTDSFRFEDPADPAPAAEPTGLDKMLKTNLGPTGQMVGVGVGVAAVVLVVGLVFLRGGKPARKHGY